MLKIPRSVIEDNNGTEADIIYVVAPGDSLWAIARQYGVTVDQLKQVNNLVSDLLSVGMELKIPTKSTIPPTSEMEVVYTVKPGDSLYRIALANNVTVDQLKKYNNLTSDILSVGQKIRIPSATQTVYVVKVGDSLWSIANRYGTTIDALRRKNNLTTDTLSIGQRLYI